jgi:outer membrane protein assembly factor BamA
LKDSEVRAWLKQKDPLFGPKIPATEPALSHYKQLVTEYLAARGYHEPISVQLALENPPDLSVLFRPAGTKPSVAQVRFTDTGEIKNEDLLLAMNPVAIGAVFTEPRFRQLLETTVRPLYEARGHLSVTFPKVVTEPAKDVKGLVVTVQVEQGPVYKLGTVGFAGSKVQADELKDLVKLKTGELANFDEVKAAEARVDDSLRRQGYLKVTSKIARTLHEADKTVDVVFQLEPGPQFSFGKLEIAGLDITTEPELRKMWGLKPGKPFNPSYPNHFLDVVREQGLFDNLGATSAETKINNSTQTVDVTLIFKGSRVSERKHDGERRPPN